MVIIEKYYDENENENENESENENENENEIINYQKKFLFFLIMYEN